MIWDFVFELNKTRQSPELFSENSKIPPLPPTLAKNLQFETGIKTFDEFWSLPVIFNKSPSLPKFIDTFCKTYSSRVLHNLFTLKHQWVLEDFWKHVQDLAMSRQSPDAIQNSRAASEKSVHGPDIICLYFMDTTCFVKAKPMGTSGSEFWCSFESQSEVLRCPDKVPTHSKTPEQFLKNPTMSPG